MSFPIFGYFKKVYKSFRCIFGEPWDSFYMSYGTVHNCYINSIVYSVSGESAKPVASVFMPIHFLTNNMRIWVSPHTY